MSDLERKIDEQIKQSVFGVIAAEVANKLSSDDREAIVAKGVTEVLNGYSFRNKIEAAVAERVVDVVNGMLVNDPWSTKLRAACEEGLQLVIKRVPEAVFQTTVQALFGRLPDPKNTYDRGAPGDIAVKLRNLAPKEVTNES